MTDEIEGASESEWKQGAEGIETDLQDFEAYIWPVFKRRGYSRDTALLCWYINLAALGITKLWDDEDDGKFGS